MWAGKPGGQYTVAFSTPGFSGGVRINWIGDAVVNIGHESMCSRIETPLTRAQPRTTRRLIHPRRVRR
jgi:hypothetical protein